MCNHLREAANCLERSRRHQQGDRAHNQTGSARHTRLGGGTSTDRAEGRHAMCAFQDQEESWGTFRVDSNLKPWQFCAPLKIQPWAERAVKTQSKPTSHASIHKNRGSTKQCSSATDPPKRRSLHPSYLQVSL
ncbi:unnamed protein product [Natator depressus]